MFREERAQLSLELLFVMVALVGFIFFVMNQLSNTSESYAEELRDSSCDVKMELCELKTPGKCVRDDACAKIFAEG